MRPPLGGKGKGKTMGMAVQPFNYRCGIHISPRYPTMRNRRIVKTTIEYKVVDEDEGGNGAVLEMQRMFEEEVPCEPDLFEVLDGDYTASHVAANYLRKEGADSPDWPVVPGTVYTETYHHPYTGASEETTYTLRGFRPHEALRVGKLLGFETAVSEFVIER